MKSHPEFVVGDEIGHHLQRMGLVNAPIYEAKISATPNDLVTVTVELSLTRDELRGLFDEVAE